eukprot:3802321-Amphidinium_carterae.2
MENRPSSLKVDRMVVHSQTCATLRPASDSVYVATHDCVLLSVFFSKRLVSLLRVDGALVPCPEVQ